MLGGVLHIYYSLVTLPRTELASMATLRVLSLSSLRSGDSTTINNLNKAVCEDGFFYLDFQDCATAILEDVISCRQLAKRVFSLPLQEKMKYDIDRIGI